MPSEVMAGFTRRLGEVRTRLIHTILFLVLASVGIYVISEWILEHMVGRLPHQDSLIFLAPSEAFITRIKLSLAGGLVVALPFVLFQIWRFVGPMLARRERIVSFLLIPLSFGLFVGGGLFAYVLMLPVVLDFLLGFGSADLAPMLAVAPYINFVVLLVLPMGAIFQLPIVVVFLTRIGIIRPAALARQRKYVILGIFVLSAILTPPDVFSQVLMAIPLLVLFEVSLLIARLARPRRRE